jgi:hypothetical protein
MPKATEGTTVEARAAQRADSKATTLSLLRNKKRAQREIVFELSGEDGKPVEVTLVFRAIGTQDYDRLLTKFPPTIEQKAEGSSYDINRFAPELMSKVCIEPEMSAKEWSEIWNSPDWNRGETMDLFVAAVEICSRGLKAVPTSELG